MKVLVVNNAAPFQRGGAEELADHLVRRLNATPGVQSELVRVPFTWEPAERLIEEMLISKGMRLYNVDRVIGLKFPAYLIPHHQKVLWLLHQFRQAYDLSEAGQSHLDFDDTGRAVKAAIRAADNACFAECRKIDLRARQLPGPLQPPGRRSVRSAPRVERRHQLDPSRSLGGLRCARPPSSSPAAR